MHISWLNEAGGGLRGYKCHLQYLVIASTLFSINFCLNLPDAVKRYNIHNFPLFILQFLLVFLFLKDYLNCTLLKLSEDLQKTQLLSNDKLHSSFFFYSCQLSLSRVFDKSSAISSIRGEVRKNPSAVEVNTMNNKGDQYRQRDQEQIFLFSKQLCGYKQAV